MYYRINALFSTPEALFAVQPSSTFRQDLYIPHCSTADLFLLLLKSFEAFAKDKIIHFKRCEGDRAHSRAYQKAHILCNRDSRRGQEIWKSSNTLQSSRTCMPAFLYQ